jgi:hypothetical protein
MALSDCLLAMTALLLLGMATWVFIAIFADILRRHDHG